MSTAPVIGTTSTSIVGVGEDQLEDRPAASIGDRRPSAVDRVRDAQVGRDEAVVERGLRRGGELGKPEIGSGHEVGQVRAGATGDRVDADARPVVRPLRCALGPRAGQRGRDLEQLVEPIDPGDAELPEHGRDDRVGAGEMPGVRLRHRGAGVGAPDLHRDDRCAGAGGVIGGQHHRAAVLEPFDVGRDDADLGLIREVAREVGELEIDLVPGRRPVRDRDADLLSLEEGSALMTALCDERERGTGQIGAELREHVEVGVRSEQVCVAGGHELTEPGLERCTVLTRLGEARGEDHRELGLPSDNLLERVDCTRREHHGQVDVAGDVVDRPQARFSEHLVARRIDREEPCAVLVGPLLDATGHGGVWLGARLRRADNRHARGMEEDIEVDVTEAQVAAADVDRCRFAHGRSGLRGPPRMTRSSAFRRPVANGCVARTCR